MEESPAAQSRSTPDTGDTRIAWLGHGNRDFIRNDSIIRCLRGLGVEVREVCVGGRLPVRYARMLRGLAAVDPEVVLVGFPGFTDVPVAWLFARLRRRSVVFDAFVSLYDSRVSDRAQFSPRSPKAWLLRALDRVALTLADLVLTDTWANADFMAHAYHVPRAKFRRVWVGADPAVRPCPTCASPADGPFRVFFAGSYIPLHGIEHILRAASLLQDRHGSDAFRLTLLGDGQTYGAMRRLADDLGLANAAFLPPVSYDRFVRLACASDAFLGVFGTSRKARAVVPRKVFDGLALGLPVVTGDTAGAREALVHGVHAWLCPPGDPAALAGALEILSRDASFRAHLADTGRAHYEQALGPSSMRQQLAEIVAEAVRH